MEGQGREREGVERRQRAAAGRLKRLSGTVGSRCPPRSPLGARGRALFAVGRERRWRTTRHPAKRSADVGGTIFKTERHIPERWAHQGGGGGGGSSAQHSAGALCNGHLVSWLTLQERSIMMNAASDVMITAESCLSIWMTGLALGALRRCMTGRPPSPFFLQIASSLLLACSAARDPLA